MLPERAAGLDDVLHCYEMLTLPLAADLVVCAACRTGFGDVRAGEGLVSMAAALLEAGARWVLVTLWQVGDLVTTAFMCALYEALAAGTGVPDAVHSARARVQTNHPDPYWWAPFVLVGAGG
jgi:CHAT domain-containing protein